MDADSTPSKHCDECRGPKSMNLLQGESATVSLPDDVEAFDILTPEHTVPSTDTTYYCMSSALK